MKYGIKLREQLGVGGVFLPNPLRSSISEHEGVKSTSVMDFKTMADAEIYAQNHEIKNYTIEPLPERSGI